MGRLFGRFLGNALLTVGLFLVGGAVFFYLRAKVEPKKTPTLTAQIQFELDSTTQMKNVVTLTPHGGDDDPVDVKVEYFANPPDVQRALLERDTNMVVRRHLAKAGEVTITFENQRVPGALEGGAMTPPDAAVQPTVVVDTNAIPGATGHTPVPAPAPAPAPGPKPTVTVTPDKPKAAAGGASGLVTIVTFPDSYVEEGNTKLGKTPLFKVKLPAGTHMLTLTGVDGSAHWLSVPVVANQTRVFKMKLDELPAK
ncbi:MAG: hypothetical protein QM723_17560 [Myxococcaceae bacterium]